jgi:hypothetical protein
VIVPFSCVSAVGEVLGITGEDFFFFFFFFFFLFGGGGRGGGVSARLERSMPRLNRPDWKQLLLPLSTGSGHKGTKETTKI